MKVMLQSSRQCPAITRLEACSRSTSHHMDPSDPPGQGNIGDWCSWASRGQIVLAANHNGGMLRLIASRHDDDDDDDDENDKNSVHSQPPSICISKTPLMIVQPLSLWAAAKFCTTMPLQTVSHTAEYIQLTRIIQHTKWQMCLILVLEHCLFSIRQVSCRLGSVMGRQSINRLWVQLSAMCYRDSTWMGSTCLWTGKPCRNVTNHEGLPRR